MTIQEFIDEITYKYTIEDTCITFFVGSGFSRWYGYPLWNKLLIDFCSKLFAEIGLHKDFLDEIQRKVDVENYSIPKAFEEIMQMFELDIEYIRAYIVDTFREIDRSNKENNFIIRGVDTDKYSELFSLSQKYKVITTNYDTLIEDMFEKVSGKLPNIYYTDTKNLNRDFFMATHNNSCILKLHGDVNRSELMIITQSEYVDIMKHEKYSLIRETLKSSFRYNIYIFLGYSLNDENIQQLLIENQNIFKYDKHKSYVFNLDLMNGIVNSSEIGYENKYFKMGVEEIQISHFDELLAVLKHLNQIKIIKEKLMSETLSDFSTQAVTKEFEVWKLFKYAIALCSVQCFEPACNVLEKLIHLYEGKKDIEWELIYSLLGVLLDCKSDPKLAAKGKKYIDEAILLSNNLDRTYGNIGNFYSVSASRKLYNSNSSARFGMIETDYAILEKGLSYYYKILNKDRDIMCQIVEAEHRYGNIEKTIELATVYKKERNYHPRIDLVLGLIYLNKAKEMRDIHVLDGWNQYFEISIELLEAYISNEEYSMESVANKEIALNSLIQSLLSIEEYEKAKDYCNKLLYINPSGDNIHRYLVEIYVHERDFDKAIEECDYEIYHTKDLARNVIKMKYIKAQCMFARANYEYEILEAIDICKTILKRHEYADVCYSISRMYHIIGRFKHMREYILKACYIYPLDVNLYNKAMDMLSGHFVGEESEYDIQESMKEMANLHIHKSNFKIDKNRISKDIFLYKDLYLRDGEKVRNITRDEVIFKDFMLGKINCNLTEDVRNELVKAFYEYSRGDYNKSLNILQSFRNVLLDNHVFKYVYANTLFLNNFINDAMSIYKYIIENEIEKYNLRQKQLLYYYYGECCFEKSLYLEAEKYYELSYSIDNSFTKALFNLGLSKYKKAIQGNGVYDTYFLIDAERCFGEYLTKDTVTWQAYDNISTIALILGHIDSAIENSIKLRGFIVPIDVKIQNYNRLIHLLLVRSDEEKAFTFIREADEFLDCIEVVDNIREGIYTFYQYKGIFYSSKSYEEAIKCFKRAYEVYPTEHNLNHYNIQSQPGSTHFIEYGNLSVARGGVMPNAT